jgi:hypothetical protein
VITDPRRPADGLENCRYVTIDAWRLRKGEPPMRLINLATVTVVVAVAVAAPALAGKGGNGNGNGNGGSSTDSATPASKPSSYSPGLYVSWPLGPVTTSTTSMPYVVNGCGYDSSYGGVTVVVYSPYAASFAGQMPTGGCISLSNFSTLGPGHYEIDAYQTVRNKRTKVASTSFDV